VGNSLRKQLWTSRKTEKDRNERMHESQGVKIIFIYGLIKEAAQNTYIKILQSLVYSKL